MTAIGQSTEAPEDGWTSRLLSSQVCRVARRRAEPNAPGRPGQRISLAPAAPSPDEPILLTLKAPPASGLFPLVSGVAFRLQSQGSAQCDDGVDLTNAQYNQIQSGTSVVIYGPRAVYVVGITRQEQQGAYAPDPNADPNLYFGDVNGDGQSNPCNFAYGYQLVICNPTGVPEDTYIQDQGLPH